MILGRVEPASRGQAAMVTDRAHRPADAGEMEQDHHAGDGDEHEDQLINMTDMLPPIEIRPSRPGCSSYVVGPQNTM